MLQADLDGAARNHHVAIQGLERVAEIYVQIKRPINQGITLSKIAGYHYMSWLLNVMTKGRFDWPRLDLALENFEAAYKIFESIMLLPNAAYCQLHMAIMRRQRLIYSEASRLDLLASGQDVTAVK